MENRNMKTGTKEDSAKLAKALIATLEDKKAVDVRLIDISEVSVLADYFIIAGGTNKSQIQALADYAEETMGRAGCLAKQVEGYDNANWVLLDFGDIVLHIFDADNRLLYDLERIWRDGKEVDPETLGE